MKTKKLPIHHFVHPGTRPSGPSSSLHRGDQSLTLYNRSMPHLDLSTGNNFNFAKMSGENDFDEISFTGSSRVSPRVNTE